MRRMFRRNIRKTLAQEVPPILQEANFTFDKGEYGRAAELFERIAQGADARGGPRAPLLLLQAGRARILAGQTALGMPPLNADLNYSRTADNSKDCKMLERAWLPNSTNRD